MNQPFTYEVNLDCPNNLEEFLTKYEPARGRRLANLLGFKGRNSVQAANGLMNYASNKRAAHICRRGIMLTQAKMYEDICDRIYQEDIQPLINCW
jgi:hypothetical protein